MKKQKRETFPALRCSMGDWFYYITSLKFSDVDCWIKPTTEIHKSENLRDMIQREISQRILPIVDYLLEQDERFFNAIVVGVYGGAPQWYPIEVGNSPVLGSPDLDEDSRNKIGLLTFEGNEQLFAIDGQHRVEAIKKALVNKPELADEDLAAIFVAHGINEAGRTRTRRLFSTLNRYAKPVSKGEIVALDEDDAFAIVTRRLVEEFDLLNPGFTIEKENTAGFVSFGKTTPIPVQNETSLTSILALYDIVETIHTPILDRNQRSAIKKLKHRRPADEILESIYQEQVEYWQLLKEYISEYQEVFDSQPHEKIVSKYRTQDGGHLMFRPLGQKTFARVVRIMMDRGTEMRLAVQTLSAAPMILNNAPWKHVLWNPTLQRINSKSSDLLREGIFLYYIRQNPRKNYDVITEYKKVVDNPQAELPIS